VTVAGAIGTGTHGSGIQQGMEAMVSSFVLEITFVTHDGRCARTCTCASLPLLIQSNLSLVTYSCEDSDNCSYRHSLLHLGALGPVSSMRLRLVPDYSMQVYAFRGACLPYVLQHYHALAASCHSFTLGLNFATGECTTWLRHKITSSYAGQCDNDSVPPPPADADMLGSALVRDVPFFELGPDVAGGW
jgi:hypothetical protein